MAAEAAERAAGRVGIITLLLLLVGSLVAYEQRMLFLDPSFVTYEIIDRGGLAIMEQRYGAFITQWVPLVTTWLGLSLRAVLVLYSLSFSLFYASVAVLVAVVWKQYRLATLLALYFTLVVSDGYYWTNNEIHQAVAWMMVFLGYYGFLARRRRSFHWSQHLLLGFLIFLTASTHLLVAAPLAFLWVYLAVEELYVRGKDARPLRLGAYSAVIGAAVYWRYALSRESWYDSYKLSSLDTLGWTELLGSFSNSQSRSMQHYLIQEYWLLFPVAVLGLAGLLLARRWWLIPITTGAILGYYALVCITYPGGFTRTMLFYFESEWMGLGLIVATPFVIHLLPRLGRPAAAAGLLAVIFALRLWSIGESYTYFDQRLANLFAVVQGLRSLPGDKFLLEPAEDWDAYFGMSWGLPGETLFLSILEGDGKQVTLKPRTGPDTPASDGAVYRGSFRDQPLSTLSGEYFHLDTLTAYRTLTGEEREEIARQLRPLPK